ncbi:MAG: UMP kinase [Candidatus Riflebacteria bacterium]|nr:UMP kinase [Candidatus Riflebacteria bacterium]
MKYYKKPLLKLSGEMLGGETGFGFDRTRLEEYSLKIAKLFENEITPSIVLGGGNLFRGARGHLPDLSRYHGDFMGMLATVMNAVCFADHLAKYGIKTRVFSAIEMPKICESYQIDTVKKAIEDRNVCFFAGGTGNPYFSTDTAAALRAVESGCDVLIKATKVDGVYDSDPMKNPKAKKFETISYGEVLAKNLGVMDLMAITLCQENKMPLLVISLKEDNLLKACSGENIGTKVVHDISI